MNRAMLAEIRDLRRQAVHLVKIGTTSEARAGEILLVAAQVEAMARVDHPVSRQQFCKLLCRRCRRCRRLRRFIQLRAPRSLVANDLYLVIMAFAGAVSPPVGNWWIAKKAVDFWLLLLEKER